MPLVSSPRVDQPSVLVIGAGLIDSSAKQLVKKGCVVPLLEASARPEAVDQAGCVMHSVSAKYNLRASPAAGASGKSWPWLNANHSSLAASSLPRYAPGQSASISAACLSAPLCHGS